MLSPAPPPPAILVQRPPGLSPRASNIRLEPFQGRHSQNQVRQSEQSTSQILPNTSQVRSNDIASESSRPRSAPRSGPGFMPDIQILPGTRPANLPPPLRSLPRPQIVNSVIPDDSQVIMRQPNAGRNQPNTRQMNLSLARVLENLSPPTSPTSQFPNQIRFPQSQRSVLPQSQRSALPQTPTIPRNRLRRPDSPHPFVPRLLTPPQAPRSRPSHIFESAPPNLEISRLEDSFELRPITPRAVVVTTQPVLPAGAPRAAGPTRAPLQRQGSIIRSRSGSFVSLVVRDSSVPSISRLEQQDCSICFEPCVQTPGACTFECRHQFHTRCAIRWLEQKASCPVCRAPTSQVLCES